MSLDPENWEDYRRTLHAVCDAVVDFMRDVREHGWSPVSDPSKFSLKRCDALNGCSFDQVAHTLVTQVMPFGSGNTHPRFFGWVQGGGNPAAFLAEIVASAMNTNCGGRNHVGTYIEREVIRWACGIFGLPCNASGILVTGTSQATVLAITIARTIALGRESKDKGIWRANRLTAYAAEGVHSAIRKAMELTGVGADAIRCVPLDAHNEQMRVTDLEELISEDREKGNVPFLVIGTAGSVDAGAIDDLRSIGELARRENLWFHVDGAFGAWLRIAGSGFAHLVDGIDLADSIACDFHKWINVQYDCGMLLVRNEHHHRSVFSNNAPYLVAAGDGIAGGDPWFSEYGIDLSRGFRALKVWTTLMTYGVDKLGESIADSCRLARLMAEGISGSDEMEVYAPVHTNVIRFGVSRKQRTVIEISTMNQQVAALLAAKGDPVVSTTRIGDVVALRACLINHRTTKDDVHTAVSAFRDAATAGRR